MLARRYTDKIELWDYVRTSDGYGGYLTTETKVKEVWASKETQGAGNKFQQFGLNQFKEPLIFRIRKGTTILTDDTYIIYKGIKYIIKGVENVDLEEREINIFAEKL